MLLFVLMAAKCPLPNGLCTALFASVSASDGVTCRTHRQPGVARSAPEAAGIDEVLAGRGQQHKCSPPGCSPSLVQVLEHEGNGLVEPALAQPASSQLSGNTLCAFA